MAMSTAMALLSVLLIGLFLSTPAQAAGPCRGQVIDKETGKPIEGAVVFVRWENGTQVSSGKWAATNITTQKKLSPMQTVDSLSERDRPGR
jgi:hypothetical protein